MVSKPRVALFMLVMLAMAGGLIALLVSLGATAFWVKTVPVVAMVVCSGFAQSMGLFRKKAKKSE